MCAQEYEHMNATHWTVSRHRLDSLLSAAASKGEGSSNHRGCSLRPTPLGGGRGGEAGGMQMSESGGFHQAEPNSGYVSLNPSEVMLLSLC